MPTDTLLFIDTNKYLDLYRTVTGKWILASLREQAEYIFVLRRVVDGVLSNKAQVAADFLNTQFKGLKLQTYKLPDHLFGATEDETKAIQGKMREIGESIQSLFRRIGIRYYAGIAASNDEVSAALATIFNHAVNHSSDELRRAAG